MRKLLLAALCVPFFLTPLSQALARTYQPQRIVLGKNQSAFHLGLGLGRTPRGDDGTMGFGVNLEMGYGFGGGFQLNLRGGVRLGEEGRATRASRYGRTLETETYGTGQDLFANPELGLRWAAVMRRGFAMALEGRIYLPFEQGTELAAMLAVPMTVRFAGSGRVLTGIYLPVVGDAAPDTTVSLPLHFWWRARRGLQVGLLSGARFRESDTAIPVGVGVAKGLRRGRTLQWWFLFPNLNQSGGARAFGTGIGIGFL